MLYMSVTCEVSNPDRFMDVREEQFQNIPIQFVSCEVSKPDRSRAVKEEHL